MKRVAVLGGGNGAHAAVVDLTLKGFEVAWWRRDAAGLPGDGTVRYSGILGHGEVAVHDCSGDLGGVLSGAALVVVLLPATAQPELVAAMAPLLDASQAVAFTPGTFGSWIGARARPDVVFLETGTLPYLARVVAPNEVAVPVVATRLPTGSIPGAGPGADVAHERFAAAYPSAVRLGDGFDGALTNWGPVLHPPLVLQNLGAIETLADRFDIHSEGTSPGVVRTILSVDAERVGLRKALGIPGEHWSIRTHYEQSPKGMYGSEAKERLVGSGLWRESLHVRHRYVTEDLLCGLVLNASIGRLAGHPMPVTEALLTVAEPSLDIDPWGEGRTLESLGIDDLEAIGRRLDESG